LVGSAILYLIELPTAKSTTQNGLKAS